VIKDKQVDGDKASNAGTLPASVGQGELVEELWGTSTRRERSSRQNFAVDGAGELALAQSGRPEDDENITGADPMVFDVPFQQRSVDTVGPVVDMIGRGLLARKHFKQAEAQGVCPAGGTGGRLGVR
jgi:hypothetical protein